MATTCRRTGAVVVLAATACLEPTLTKTDDPPVAVIQSPGDDAQYDAGTAIEFVGRVADDGPVELVDVAWFDNGSTVLAEGVTPDAEGYVYFTTADLLPGVHAVTLRATDPGNQVHEDAVTLEVLEIDNEPNLQIVRPASTDAGEVGEEFVFEALVSDAQDEPTALTVELASDLDGYVCDLPVDGQGTALCRAALISEGDHRLTFRVTDSDGYFTEESTLFPVAPVPEVPVITVIEPSAGAAILQAEPLAFTAEVSDRQDEPLAMVASVSSDIEGYLCPLTIDVSGGATCWAALQTLGNHILTFTVTDTDLNTSSVNVLVQVVDSSGIDDDGDGFAEVAGDCDDADITVYPGAPELPDGQDNDCDGFADEGTILADDDGDGFCESQGQPCTDGATQGDCDDAEFLVNPSALERCGDGIDNNCDGVVDEAQGLGCIDFYIDGDRDGYGAIGTSASCLCAATAPYDSLNSDDCNDALASVNPGQAELPDGLDNDCDGTADEGTVLWDDDGDGFCESPTGPCADGSLVGDCNDALFTVNPGVPEVCNDGLDNDCDGVTNEPGAVGCVTYFQDTDGDGYGDPSASLCACSAPPTAVANSSDCDDTNASIAPGGTETPNGLDDDCDGTIDEGTVLWDDDGDGFCESTSVPCADGSMLGDCDDGTPLISPDASEVCNDGIDNDCDLAQDEANAVGCTNYYIDNDGDGYGDPAGEYCLCSAPPTGVLNDDDCDDNNRFVRPGGNETANGVDDDCDGFADEGTVRFDNDGDGYCEAAFCTTQPDGTTATGGDCNDSNPNISPGAIEACGNNIDENCNNQINEGENTINCTTYYYDWDYDNYGVAPGVCTCGPVGLYTATNDDDCYDYGYLTFPGQTQYFYGDRGDGSFDYNCNGTEEKLYGRSSDIAQCFASFSINIGFGNINISCAGDDGWADGIPDCGVRTTWVDYCEYDGLVSGLINGCFDADIWDGDWQSWGNRWQSCR